MVSTLHIRRAAVLDHASADVHAHNTHRMQSGKIVTSKPYIVASLAVLALLGALAWSLLRNGGSACSEPWCAVERYRVALEIDAVAGTAVPALRVPAVAGEMQDDNEPADFTAVLAQGGVRVDVRIDQTSLPLDAGIAGLEGADLYQYAAAWRDTRAHPGVDAQVYALIANRIFTGSGHELFGLMFDIDGREAFAVAPAATQAAFARFAPAYVPQLQLRTMLHEFLHVLNRGHRDAVAFPDGRVSLEAPTRCLALPSPEGWRLREPPRFALSPATIAFLQAGAASQVLPGRGHAGYAGLGSAMDECVMARASRAPEPAQSRWQAVLQRLTALLGRNDAHAAPAARPSTPTAGATQPATQPGMPPVTRLQLQGAVATYPLGYPVALRVVLWNETGVALPLRGRLQPEYDHLMLETRRAGTRDWKPFKPLQHFEALDATAPSLQVGHGERTEQTIEVFQGSDGWTFSQPGRYEVRARLALGGRAPAIASTAIGIEINAPVQEREKAALAVLLDARGQLDPAKGRQLAFGGRIGDITAMNSIARSAELHADTALGSALRLTVASSLLRPALDARTGTRRRADPVAAQALLAQACTESGVAALGAALALAAEGRTTDAQARERASRIAWDGRDARGQPATTYAEPSHRLRLRVQGYGFARSSLSPRAAREVRRIARTLRRERTTRIVVVGHTDRMGSCAYNDALALQRANAVRRALVRAGVTARRIDVATLGARRPLSLEDTRVNRANNRRVEILTR